MCEKNDAVQLHKQVFTHVFSSLCGAQVQVCSAPVYEPPPEGHADVPEPLDQYLQTVCMLVAKICNPKKKCFEEMTSGYSEVCFGFLFLFISIF